MTDTISESMLLSPDQRARIAALDVVTTLLLRRLALESSSPVDELDRFRDRALADAADAACEWRTPKEDVELWIRSLCQVAAARL